MTDDNLFDRLYEMINQPGDINYDLALEVATHLSGPPEPQNPWDIDELLEIARAGEIRARQAWEVPFSLAELVLYDRKGWVEANIKSYAYVMENMLDGFGIEAVDTDDLEQGIHPAAELILGKLKPVLLGTQIGSLVGTHCTWAIASFDFGYPPQGNLAPSIITTNFDQFGQEHDLDQKELGLWAVLNELAHRTVWGEEWGTELLGNRLATLGSDFPGINELTAQFQTMEGKESFDLFEDLLTAPDEGTELPPELADLSALLGLMGSFTRQLVYQAAPEMEESFSEIYHLRDETRDQLGDGMTHHHSSILVVDNEDIDNADEFCHEVERRFGTSALTAIVGKGDRVPTAVELADPLGWAARALLDDFQLPSISEIDLENDSEDSNGETSDSDVDPEPNPEPNSETNPETSPD